MNIVHMYSKPDCVWCDRAKELLTAAGYEIYVYDISTPGNNRNMFVNHGHKTVPQVYTDRGDLIGGYEDVKLWLEM